MELKSIKDVNLKGKRVLLLVDYDTPVKLVNGKSAISDDTRIRVSLPTIHYLLQHQAKIIILTKRGRPDGKVIAEFRVDIAAAHLQKLLGKKVTKLNETLGPKVEAKILTMRPGDILMLENTRFLPGQTTNDENLARQIAKLGDLVVNDDFSVSHRAQATHSAIAKFLPMYAGLQLMLEVKMLSKLVDQPQHPFVAIIGGAKISDKLPAIENLAKIADVVLVGGGVANNFLKSQGFDVAKSYLEDTAIDKAKRHLNYIKLADDLLDSVQNEKTLINGIPITKIQYSLDVVATDNLNAPTTSCLVNVINPQDSTCPDEGYSFVDIGPLTRKFYAQVISQAKTIFWNGPMGMFENPKFAHGTKAVAQAIAANKSAVTIIGGGDTIAAVTKFGLFDKYDYVSAAGGASLDFLAGKILPGLASMIK